MNPAVADAPASAPAPSSGSGVSSRGRSRARTGDALGALTAFAVLLFLIPAVLVVGPLGAAGSPATLLGLGLLMWWACARMLPSMPVGRGYQPVRLALAVFVGIVLLTYVLGNVHPLTTNELSSADRGLLSVASWSGIALVAADMLRTRESVEKLLKRIVILGAVIAGIGVIQFMSGIDLVGFIKIPGLSVNNTIQAIQGDGPVRRVGATASHPIEYGMVLALVLPFALHYAFLATKRKVWWWSMVVCIGVALPMSLSRSAIIGVVAEFIVLFAVWSPRRRLRALAVAPLFIIAMRLMISGLVGTIFSIFSNASDDPSLQGRADSRNAAGVLIDKSPWFGRGFNTYLPSEFQQLGLKGVNHGAFDNQYLGTVVDMGYVGLFALIVVLVIALGLGRGIRIRGLDGPSRDLGQAFFAAFLATAIGMGTFDGLGFPMFMGLFVLLFGIAGAQWRINRDDWRRAHDQVARPRARRPLVQAVS